MPYARRSSFPFGVRAASRSADALWQGNEVGLTVVTTVAALVLVLT